MNRLLFGNRPLEVQAGIAICVPEINTITQKRILTRKILFDPMKKLTTPFSRRLLERVSSLKQLLGLSVSIRCIFLPLSPLCVVSRPRVPNTLVRLSSNMGRFEVVSWALDAYCGVTPFIREATTPYPEPSPPARPRDRSAFAG